MTNQDKSTRSAHISSRWVAGALFVLTMFAFPSFAHGGASSSASAPTVQPPTASDRGTNEAFSVPAPGQTLKLDGHTELQGWALPRGWYFGKHRGEHSGIGFLWQAADRQLSLSTKGIRFVRRF